MRKIELISGIFASAVALAIVLGPIAAPAAGQEAELDADEIARQSSNPLGGNFFILLNQFDNYFMEGDATNKTRYLNTWSIQPVIPISMKNLIGENWIWVNRPTFPIVLNADLPDVGRIKTGIMSGNVPTIPPRFPERNLPFDSYSGFGDIVYFSLLGQSLPQERWGGGDLVWAGGLTTQWPTASRDELGTDKYSAGPAAVLSFIGKKFIVGGLGQHWWDYGGSGDADVNFSWLNVFYFWNLENGWQVGGTPVITVDWEADSDNGWTIPIGLGVYKSGFVPKIPMPMKLGVEFQWMPIRPDTYGQIFNIRLVIAPIMPYAMFTGKGK